MVESVKRVSYWFYLFLVLSPSSFVYASSHELEQQLSQQLQINPEAVFNNIEVLLAGEETSLRLKAKLLTIQSEISFIIDRPENILKYAKAAIDTGLLDETWHTRALISQSRAYFQRGQYEEYFLTANKAVIKAEKSNLLNYKIAALVERAYAQVFLGDDEKATNDLTIAIKYLELSPENFDKAMILESFSAAQIRLNNIQTAIKHQHQAIAIYEKINSPHYLSISYYNLARIYQMTEDWHEASQWMLKSYQYALTDDNKLNQAFSLTRLSEYQNNLGNLKQAKKHLKKAIIAADESSSELVKITVRKNMVSILCQNKEFIACKNLLIESISFAETFKMQRDKIEFIKKLADTYSHLGEFEKAYLTLQSANINNNE